MKLFQILAVLLLISGCTSNNIKINENTNKHNLDSDIFEKYFDDTENLNTILILECDYNALNCVYNNQYRNLKDDSLFFSDNKFVIYNEEYITKNNKTYKTFIFIEELDDSSISLSFYKEDPIYFEKEIDIKRTITRDKIYIFETISSDRFLYILYK